jgi:Leucine-rich repeat (LRR) protein
MHRAATTAIHSWAPLSSPAGCPHPQQSPHHFLALLLIVLLVLLLLPWIHLIGVASSRVLAVIPLTNNQQRCHSIQEEESSSPTFSTSNVSLTPPQPAVDTTVTAVALLLAAPACNTSPGTIMWLGEISKYFRGGFWELIEKFSKVEHLSFSGNQFTKIPEWFRFPKSLKSLKISSSHVSALFLDKLNDLPDFELLVGVDINGMYDPAFSIDGRKEEEIEEKRALSFVVISFISSPIAINCLSVITP